jgi:hypothetical protein
MIRMWKSLLLLLAFAGGLLAQTHTVTLTWTDTVNPAGTTYDAYRLTGSCPAQPPTTTAGFTLLNSSAITAKSYADTSVIGGTTYCYVVTAVGSSGPQSAPSPDVQAIVPGAFPPQTVTATAN